MTERVFLGLGSNIEPHAHILRAVRMLKDKFSTLTFSPIYRTPAEQFEGDEFLNLVVRFDTRMTLTKLRLALREIERLGGRRRELETEMGPRTIDLDVLMYGDLNGEYEGIRLPRPETFQRRYVWQPLAELMMDESPQSDVEESTRIKVMGLWNERLPAPEGFERTYIPSLT